MHGVIYITAMDRPDAALALAMLYTLQGRQETKIGSVCVEGSGFGAARFCDILYRFFMPGPPRNANEVLPTGFAVASLPDPPMVKPVLDAAYPRTIAKVSDTSLAESVIRNGVTFNAETVMILSAPATSLAKSLDIQGAKDLFKERVKMLLIVDPRDTPAMRRVMAEFPAPIVLCGKEIGDALPYPAAAIVEHHPVFDAYTAYRPMPYDAPSYDMAAALYAVRLDSGLFQVSDNRLTFDPAQKDKIIATYIELATAKPVVPVRRPKPAA